MQILQIIIISKQCWTRLDPIMGFICCTKTSIFPLSRPWPTPYTAWSAASGSCGSSSAPKWTSGWQLRLTHTHTQLNLSLNLSPLWPLLLAQYFSPHRHKLHCETYTHTHTLSHSGFSGREYSQYSHTSRLPLRAQQQGLSSNKHCFLLCWARGRLELMTLCTENNTRDRTDKTLSASATFSLLFLVLF